MQFFRERRKKTIMPSFTTCFVYCCHFGLFAEPHCTRYNEFGQETAKQHCYLDIVSMLVHSLLIELNERKSMLLSWRVFFAGRNNCHSSIQTVCIITKLWYNKITRNVSIWNNMYRQTLNHWHKGTLTSECWSLIRFCVLCRLLFLFVIYCISASKFSDEQKTKRKNNTLS